MSIYTHPHFIDNKYNTLYFKIINNAKQRSEVSGYTEKHHIIPRSMGGSDLPENLVILTAREHFICHYLLTKFTISNCRLSMFYAFRMMALKPNPTNNNRYMNSRMFESIKEDHRKAISESMRGRKHTVETIAKMSATKTGKVPSEETRQRLALAQTGKKLSDETKEKMSVSRKGKPKSAEHIAKIAASNKGSKRSPETREKISEALKKAKSQKREANPLLTFLDV